MTKLRRQVKTAKSLSATSTVYCYYYPEIRRIIDKIVKRYPHEVFLRSIKPGLDCFHKPLIAKYRTYFKKELQGLAGFTHSYIAGGASEPIFHILAQIAAKENETPIYILRGEYQGYREYGKELGLAIRDISEEEAVSVKLHKGIFFISNPGARDGMIISNTTINAIARRHRIIFDVTYVGLTRPHTFDLRNKNIIAIVSSMSKPFGLYYYRIGFAFSRARIATLEPNKWFKNIFSIIIADKILSMVKPGYLYKKYAPMQKKIIIGLNKKYSLNLRPADVMILATAQVAAVKTLRAKKLLKRYKRGNAYRLCLTQYFLKKESSQVRN